MGGGGIKKEKKKDGFSARLGKLGLPLLLGFGRGSLVILEAFLAESRPLAVRLKWHSRGLPAIPANAFLQFAVTSRRAVAVVPSDAAPA